MDIVVRKPDFLHVNSRGADQPVHLRRMINAFVIGLLESIITKLAAKFQYSS